jgi:hypothetical protein
MSQIIAKSGGSGSAATHAGLPDVSANQHHVAFVQADHDALANPHHAQDHHARHDAGGADAMVVDAAAGTGSLRTLGPGAAQAAPGNDARLSDARTPTGHHATHEPAGSDPMAVDAAAATGSLRTLGTGAQQAAPGNHGHTFARTFLLMGG